MSWTETGPAIDVGDAIGGTPTSTATVLGEDAAGDVLLRMFGVSEGQLDYLGGGLYGPRPADCGAIVQGIENVGYIESTSAPASTATAADLQFQPTGGAGTIPRTVIPRIKDGVMLEDGSGSTVSSYVLYKDPHVLELPDGRGWLMVLGRYHRPSSEGGFGEGYRDNAGRDNTMSAIVGFWAPASDPTFTGNGVKGPFWLVGRWHTVGGSRAPLWLGVPATAVVEVGGVETLFVYYTAEATTYAQGGAATPADSVQGTYLRQIALSVLLSAVSSAPGGMDDDEALSSFWVDSGTAALLGRLRAAGSAIAAGRLMGLPWSVTSLQLARLDLEAESRERATEARALAFVDEEQWVSEAEAWLVLGTAVGKVRVWVATGTEFRSYADPASSDQDNTLIEEHFSDLKVVDAVPVVDGGELVLFFSGNLASVAVPEGLGWGIWRATALDPTIGEFGLDFVVDDDLSDRILASPDTGDSMKLDPDPVLLPDGTWVVFAGEAAAALVRLEGGHDDVFVPTEDAWP